VSTSKGKSVESGRSSTEETVGHMCNVNAAYDQAAVGMFADAKLVYDTLPGSGRVRTWRGKLNAQRKYL